jgi:hypothetical protein
MCPDRESERGAALILVMIFTVLLYALVAELQVTGRTARLTGENDALLARMRNHMEFSLGQVEEMLLDDLVAGLEGDGGGPGAEGGAFPGVPTGGMPGEGGAAGEEGAEEEEPEASAIADGSQDAWYEPTAYSDNDLTTYVWVEDENRKFNILSMVSPDQEFALESRERFVRLIDYLRDDTEFDLTRSDGDLFASRITEWMQSLTRSEDLPRPPLKSDHDGDRTSLPLHLDELRILPDITDEIFFDKVLDGEIILGLESVLTVYTSLAFDPGDPDKAARLGREPPPNVEDPATPGAGSDPGAAEGMVPDQQPLGLGIRININTATRPVLRSLFSPAEFPDEVVEAILRWRNEPMEEADLTSSLPEDYYGDFDAGLDVQYRMVTDLAELDEIPEFQNLADPTVREKFAELVTVKSDVFSVHMASLYKRNEENRSFVMRRMRSVVIRLDNGQDGYLHPIILLEERHGLRVMPVDFDQDELDQIRLFDEMDQFSQEERAWNPFYLDFYLPKDRRETLFTYQNR